MKEIRESVYSICDRRRQNGKKWGTLGFIVGEEWDGVEAINEHTYSGDGLRSAFDFNSRYYMIQGAAQEESGKGGLGIEIFSNIHRTTKEKGYIDGVYPTAFVSNHDTWRFGNLVRGRYNVDVDNDLYWKIHKIVIAALSIYSGPICFFYGDEYGDITSCWHGNREDCGSTTFSDNCARTDGKIDNFNKWQTDLIQFTRIMLNARKRHTSMYKGNYQRIFSNGDTYVNIKTDPQNDDKVIYATTLSNSNRVVQIDTIGSVLVDIVNGDKIKKIDGNFTINLGPYETRVFSVDDDVDEKKEKKNKNVWFIVSGIAGFVLLVTLIILIIVLVKDRKKKNIDNTDEDQNPLLDNLHDGYTDA